jgi:aquaporin Z
VRSLLAEFVGTFFLMLSICLAVAGGAGAATPFAVGVMLVALVYSCGHLSGAHFNPVVSLVMLSHGRLTRGECGAYAVTQLAATVIAALTALALHGKGAPTPMTFPGLGAALLSEILGTFALLWVILNVAVARATQGNSYFGLAIGLTVAACGSIFGDFSGGVFNPAVAVGGAVFGLFRWSDLWVHVVGAAIGGAAAAGAFRLTGAGGR